MNRKAVGFAVCMFVGLAFGHAAGPYDGTWKGHSRSNDSCKNAGVTLTVVNGTVSVTIGGIMERYPSYMAKQVGPDGKVTLPSNGGSKRALDVTFSGDNFELHTQAACGEVNIAGRRVAS